MRKVLWEEIVMRKVLWKTFGKNFFRWSMVVGLIAATIVFGWSAFHSLHQEQTLIHVKFLEQLSTGSQKEIVQEDIVLDRSTEVEIGILSFMKDNVPAGSADPEALLVSKLKWLGATGDFEPGSYINTLHQRYPGFINRAVEGDPVPAEKLRQIYQSGGVNLYPIGLTGILIMLTGMVVGVLNGIKAVIRVTDVYNRHSD